MSEPGVDYYLHKASDALLDAHRLSGIGTALDRMRLLLDEADKWTELARIRAGTSADSDA